MNKNEIIEKINKHINELVYEKTALIKAYNYYHGKRDPEQFRHLEENYGIGTPTSIEFVPLVKKHIDVLVGEYLTIPINPRVSCKDSETLSNIFREKQIAIADSVINELKGYLTSLLNGGSKTDTEVEKRISIIIEDLQRNFNNN